MQLLRNYKTGSLAAMTIVLCLVSLYLSGNAAPKGNSQFEKKLANAHSSLTHGALSKTMDGVDQSVALSEKAVGNPEYTHAVAVEAASRSYSSEDPKAAIHLQILLAMQNQKVIEQNERIIALLERREGEKTASKATSKDK